MLLLHSVISFVCHKQLPSSSLTVPNAFSHQVSCTQPATAVSDEEPPPDQAQGPDDPSAPRETSGGARPPPASPSPRRKKKNKVPIPSALAQEGKQAGWLGEFGLLGVRSFCLRTRLVYCRQWVRRILDNEKNWELEKMLAAALPEDTLMEVNRILSSWEHFFLKEMLWLEHWRSETVKFAQRKGVLDKIPALGVDRGRRLCWGDWYEIEKMPDPEPEPFDDEKVAVEAAASMRKSYAAMKMREDIIGEEGEGGVSSPPGGSAKLGMGASRGGTWGLLRSMSKQLGGLSAAVAGGGKEAASSPTHVLSMSAVDNVLDARGDTIAEGEDENVARQDTIAAGKDNQHGARYDTIVPTEKTTPDHADAAADQHSRLLQRGDAFSNVVQNALVGPQTGEDSDVAADPPTKDDGRRASTDTSESRRSVLSIYAVTK